MTKKMKIRATQDAWYKKSRVYEGQVVDYYGETVPCWGTLASGEQVAVQTKSEDGSKQQSLLEQNSSESITENNNTPSTAEENVKQNVDKNGVQTKSEDELKAELEKLRDIAVDNNVWLDNADKMTVLEEIAALKELFKAKKIEV